MNGKSDMKTPITVRITFALLVIHAIFWLGFGVAVLLRLHPAMPESPALLVLMGTLAIGAGIVFILMIVFLFRHWKPAFHFSLFFLAVVVFFTFADDVGGSDLVYLAAVLAPIILLVVDRRWYLGE